MKTKTNLCLIITILVLSTNWPGGNTDWHCWDSNFQDTDCE